MRTWYLSFSLFDSEPGSGGGDGSTTLVDPGAPYEHEFEAPAPAKAEKSETDKALDEIRAENKRLADRLQKSEDDAKFWARRANQKPEAPAPVVIEREVAAPPAAPAEKPQKLMDDLSASGLNALFERGVIDQATLVKALSDLEKRITDRVEGRVTQERADAEFTGRLQRDFPEIWQDSQAVEAGREPKSELWPLAMAEYQEMVRADPELLGSQTALLKACQFAKRTLEFEKKKGTPVPKDDDDDDEVLVHRGPRGRRDRVERAANDRGGDDETGSQAPHFTREQSEVMKHLKVSPEQFAKNGGGRRGGR